MTPRPARIWHLPALARVLWSHTRADDHPRARSRLSDLVLLNGLRRRDTLRMVRHGGRITGFLARRDGLILALYVSPGARRRGLGRALLREAKAQTAALSIWTPQDNAVARRFYAAEGFVTMGYGDGSGNDEALPEVLMVWSANPHHPGQHRLGRHAA
ncbi:MAG: GNAT family N-acetyltransferase [Rhodobacteraceae bacterium]|nr:GNAT family N-acetyltransferase [Paracoccaceae bacterium]MBR9822395.1 GNAT family N-acetyltransferase [Paracoccaceae bacterium]